MNAQFYNKKHKNKKKEFIVLVRPALSIHFYPFFFMIFASNDERKIRKTCVVNLRNQNSFARQITLSNMQT